MAQALYNDDGGTLTDAPAVFRQSHQRVTRVSILDDLFNPLPGLTLTGDDGYVINGSVAEDTSGAVHRTLDLSIANPNGIWTPDGVGSAFYWDRQIKVERGVRVGGVNYYAPLGVYVIDQPEVDSAGHTLGIVGADRMDRATGSEFTEPTTYDAGERVGEVIQDILVNAGVGSQFWTIDDGGKTLGVARNYEAGDERLQAALTLATSFSLVVHAVASGYMVVEPKVDPMDVPSSWTFEEGVDATHITLSKRWSRDRFYNHVLVTNDTSDDTVTLIRSEALITDPANPLRVDGPLGDRLYKYVSAMITTQGQADETAASLLAEHALIEEEIEVEHVPNPLVEIHQAVTIRDEVSKTDDKFLVWSLNMPLGAGSASLTVKKVRNIL